MWKCNTNTFKSTKNSTTSTHYSLKTKLLYYYSTQTYNLKRKTYNSKKKAGVVTPGSVVITLLCYLKISLDTFCSFVVRFMVCK